MKKLLISAIAVATIATTVIYNAGCKYVPDTKQVETLAFAIGAASGVICKMAITNEATFAVVCDIMEEVDGLVPQTNESCVVVWEPVIKKLVSEAYADGKITEDQAIIITKIAVYAAQGVDWMFKTHPKWKEYADIGVVAEKGFVAGFMYVVEKKVTICVSPETDNCIIIDYDAYNYFGATYKFD